MTAIDLRRLIYTPCDKCSKCPYDCNQFEYVVDTKTDTRTVPIPKEYNKECYEQVAFLNI